MRLRRDPAFVSPCHEVRACDQTSQVRNRHYVIGEPHRQGWRPVCHHSRKGPRGSSSLVVASGGVEISQEGLGGFFLVTSPLLDERQQRPHAAAMVEELGREGQARVAGGTGM